MRESDRAVALKLDASRRARFWPFERYARYFPEYVIGGVMWANIHGSPCRVVSILKTRLGLRALIQTRAGNQVVVRIRHVDADPRQEFVRDVRRMKMNDDLL